MNEEDFFNYTVVDATGRKDFGAVHINRLASGSGPIEHKFDFGTSTSAVSSGYTRVTNSTRNSDFGWTSTSDLDSRDRGTASGIDNLTRDFVSSSETRTFEVALSPGVWQVRMTFGDRNNAHDNMQVRAEGSVRIRSFSTNRNQIIEQTFASRVTDGRLQLEFSDTGGSDPNWVVNGIVLSKIEDGVLDEPNSRLNGLHFIRAQTTDQNMISTSRGNDVFMADRATTSSHRWACSEIWGCILSETSELSEQSDRQAVRL